MRRFYIGDMTGDGTFENAYRPGIPAGATGFNLLAHFGGKCLIEIELPDGTAQDNFTIADITSDGQVEIGNLPTIAKTRIKTWLISKGFTTQAALIDTLEADSALAISNKRRLLRFLAKEVFNEPGMIQRLKDEFGIT